MNRLLWKLLLWWLKTIGSPWYMRKKAEDAMINWGLVPHGNNGWLYKSLNKQVIAHVGSFVVSAEHGFRFYCHVSKVYGEYAALYFPLKEGHLYTMEELIQKFTVKTPQYGNK